MNFCIKLINSSLIRTIPRKEQHIKTFNLNSIKAGVCRKAIRWIEENKKEDPCLLIDSLGGLVNGEFYDLIAVIETYQIKTHASRAHSAAAIIFLSGSCRKVTPEAQIAFKPQQIFVSLKQASSYTPNDIKRLRGEYDRYCHLLERLLNKNSLVTKDHLLAIIEKEAVVIFDAENAVCAKLAQEVAPFPSS